MKNSHKKYYTKRGCNGCVTNYSTLSSGGFKNAKAFLNYFTGRKHKLLLHLLHGSS